MNELTLKSTIDNLPFKMHRIFIENAEIIQKLDANEDIVIDIALPAKVLTKVLIQLKLSAKAAFTTTKPVSKDFSLDVLSSSTKSLVQEVTKEASYLKELVNLQLKLHLKHFTELIGFMVAYYFRNKDKDEINAFFDLKSDFTDEEVNAVKNTMEDLNINF